MPHHRMPTASERTQLLSDTYVALAKDDQIWNGDLIRSLRHIVRACANALGVQRASIWRLAPDYSTLTCLTLYREDTDLYEQGAELTAHRYPRYFSALAQERMIAANDAQTDLRTREFTDTYLKPLDIRSMLDSTLRRAGKTCGVLCLEETGVARLWTREEQNFAASLADLISQVLIFNDMRDSEARYRALFDATGDAIFVVRNRVFADCNPAALTMFGSSREGLIGQPPSAFSPAYQPDQQPSDLAAGKRIQAALEGTPQIFEWLHCQQDGTPFMAEVTLSSVMLDGDACLIGIVRDISERKRQQEALAQSRQQLEHRAFHDALTGLPNRDCLHDQARELLRQAKTLQQPLAVLLLDLNRFKEVNDTLGHIIGDELLKTTADHLQQLLTPRHARLYRLGGDEFAVVSAPLTLPQAAEELAHAISQQLRQPQTVAGIRLELGASIGIALFPLHGTDSHALLRCADVAMYHAKSSGTGTAQYDTRLDSYNPRRLTLITELGTAIRENQLQLHFQPRLDLVSGRCSGCEALLRWQHPVHGMVPPGDFIPLAEMNDIIHSLSLWVIRNALETLQQWQQAGCPLPIAVNLSARNLADPRFPDKLAELLQSFTVAPELLEIEITESALINDPERALQVVDRIHQLGIPLAIDDFGTGYSSLSYLKRLPIGTLKIDRSFVKDMLTDDADAVIVRSTIGLAHSFGLTVVAEGVEDQATLNALRQLDCDQAQGYYIARPLALAAFDDWLGKHLGQ